MDGPVQHEDTLFLRCILNAMQNPVFIKNERHQWIAFNSAFSRLIGWSYDQILYKSDFDVLPEDQARVFWEMDNSVFSSGTPNSNEEQITAADGEVRWLLTTKAPFTYNNCTYLVGVITDITERRRAEATARVMAREDALTGLPNRRLLQEHLQHIKAAWQRRHGAVALMIIDLDDFKHINDTLGHSVGDTFLIEIANRLRTVARGSDLVARLGGDEFAVIATSEDRPEQFGAMAERLVARLGDTVSIGDLSVRSSASVGVAICSDDGFNTDTLLAQADLALYASKAAGKNTWCFFEAAMQERAYKLVELEHELHDALERDEFVLYYQPIYSANGNKLVGYEALVRWNNPKKGLLLPGHFMDAVERNRLIVPLTFWTITEALRQVGVWARAGKKVGVAINLATSVLEVDGLVEHILSRLALEKLSPQRLTVEVIEGAIVNGGKVVAVLRQLRAMGIRVAIDDFGAGHSSLGRLDEIPADILKIDRLFISTPTRRRRAILHATINLARSLGLRTVVEGVETRAQLDLVRRLRADAVQGYYLARPMPVEQINREQPDSEPVEA